MRRRARAGRGGLPAPSSSAARAASRSPSRPAVTMRFSTRSRAACALCRIAVGAAALGQLRQRDEQGCLRDASGASAPCRNRRARRRARPRDCRHRARASGSARGSRCLVSRRSICMARKIWRSFVPKLRLSRGSISRASCIDSVEPPDTMRPLPANCAAARSSASGSTPLMVPEALVFIGDQHLDKLRVDLVEAWSRAASGRRPWQKRAAARRRGRRLRVETGELLPAAAAGRRGRGFEARPERGRRGRRSEPPATAVRRSHLLEAHDAAPHPRPSPRERGEEASRRRALLSPSHGRGAGRRMRGSASAYCAPRLTAP